jgi:antitoxin HicB
MGGASGSEAETRLGEVRVEDRREDLQDGLLDHPIGYRRDPQRTFPSRALRDHDPQHRRGSVAAIQQGLANRGPMLPHEVGELLQDHPVTAGSALVGLDPPVATIAGPTGRLTGRNRISAIALAARGTAVDPVLSSLETRSLEVQMKFRVLLQQDKDGGFVAEVPSLPGCISQGDTRTAALANIREAIEGYLYSLRAHGEPIPPPIGEEPVDVGA